MMGCSPEPSDAPAPLETTSTAPDETNFAPDEPAPATSTLLQVGGPSGYTGSGSCRSCHEDQFATWHRSYHRTMTQVATLDTVQADFQNVVLTNESTRFVLSRKNDEFWVRMEALTAILSADLPPPSLDTRISLITGSHHMQVFWVPSGHGNAQIGFPFTWLIPEKRWVPRNLTFIRPPDAVHRTEVWNFMCSRCHATGVEPRVDSQARTVSTRVGELGISCEACHGPGQRHVDARSLDRDNLAGVNDAILRTEIVHPKKIDPVRASQICGFCHSMKWFDQSSPWRQQGFRYRPGDDLEETTPMIRPSQTGALPGLTDFLARNPDLLQDFFWSDGMIRVSGREYNGLIESPCFNGGKFSCLSCHSPHESDPDDQLIRTRFGNRACTLCHEPFRDESRLLAHTHHRADSTGSECYNCHMPHTTYGVLKGIRSHQISNPKVADQLATGRPNACNLCHLDKPLAWTAGHLQQWYSHAVPALSDEQIHVADAVRLALAGDAGQRALLAWHLAWPPALHASGKSWIPPLLGRLLDDPYAAVRCIAERSLTTFGDILPDEYDYTVSPPVVSAPLQEQLLQNWKRQITAAPADTIPSETLVQVNDPAAMREAFDRLTRRRDNRPVRLRE